MNSLAEWIAFLEKQIWEQPADELDRARPGWESALRRCAIEIKEVLQELPDECLAVAIQKAFWWIAAFEELFICRYEEKLARWYYRWHVVSQEDARDLVQDIYQRFLANRLESFNSEQSFVAYLHRSARNLQRDLLRKRRELTNLTSQLEPAARRDNPEDEAAYREFAARLRQAITRLPALQQEVFSLTLDDLAPRDIATRLEMPIQQVYGHLFRARRQLERELDLGSQTRLYTRQGKSLQDAEAVSEVGEQ